MFWNWSKFNLIDQSFKLGAILMKNMTFILYPEGITLILKQHLGGFTSPEEE